ncbi:MAG: hypothetical protein F6J93_34355 [Oscillatoria sp. SIO1A7]|nr:hypothetical protein [Oscillatoria sp. SIO1A7]
MARTLASRQALEKEAPEWSVRSASTDCGGFSLLVQFGEAIARIRSLLET